MTLPDQPSFGPYIVERPICARASVELLRATFFSPGGRGHSVALRRTRPLHDGEHEKLVEAACGYAVLKHDDVVPVLDFGCLGNRTYVATPLVRGRNLLEVLARCGRRKMGFPTDVALLVVRRALDALEHAHAKRQTHGDLSHTNVLLTLDGDVMVADFGLRLASTRRRSPRGLDVGLGRGLASYLAPEQARGGAPSPSTDVFALGILLYELVTGRVLFSGADESQILEAVAEGSYEVPLEQHRPDLHPALTRLILTALAPDPRDRFADAGAFQAAIDELVDQLGVNLSRVLLNSFMGQLFSDRGSADAAS